MSRRRRRFWRNESDRLPFHKRVIKETIDKCLWGIECRGYRELRAKYEPWLIQSMADAEDAEVARSLHECRTCGRELPALSSVGGESRKYIRAGFCSKRCALELEGEGTLPEQESSPWGQCKVCGGPLKQPSTYTSDFRPFARQGFCSRECVTEAQLTLGGAEAPHTGRTCKVCGSAMQPTWTYWSHFRKYAAQGFCSAGCAEQAGVKAPPPQAEHQAAPVGSPPCRVCGTPVRPSFKVAPGLRPIVRSGFCSRKCAEQAGFIMSTDPAAIKKWNREHPQQPHRRTIRVEMYASRRALNAKFKALLELMDRISDAKGDPTLVPVLISQARLAREDLESLIDTLNKATATPNRGSSQWGWMKWAAAAALLVATAAVVIERYA